MKTQLKCPIQLNFRTGLQNQFSEDQFNSQKLGNMPWNWIDGYMHTKF